MPETEHDGVQLTLHQKPATGLGDQYDRQLRAIADLPDVVKTKMSVVRSLSKVLELTESWTIQTFRQAGEGDWIFLENGSGRDGLRRLVIPPAVSRLLLSQYNALTAKSRSRAAKATAAQRKALGIAPGFLKKTEAS